jgi:hypothetical protein
VNNLMVADRWGWRGPRDHVPTSCQRIGCGREGCHWSVNGDGLLPLPNGILIVSEIHQEMFRIYPGDRPGSSYLYRTYAIYKNSS